MISANAATILEKRYLDGESVDSMWDRVSGGNGDYRRLLSELRFLPNSPTLFNAGRNNGCTLSACFVFCVDDEMGPLSSDSPRSIHNTRGKAIAVAKAGGGVGYYFGDLRPKNSLIKSIHRKACGPVAVLRDYHAIRQLVTQGGKRDLAQMGILPCWHDDVLEFVHAKDEDPKSLESFNLSVSWTDEWIEHSKKPGTKAHDLWIEQVDSAWKHGCPGMYFYDTANRTNPNKHLGLLKSTNPCGEVPNRSDEPCNLGSLSLVKYFDYSNRVVDWDALSRDAYLATRFLDDILDRNVFPHPDITSAANLTRRLGLGVMGWADLLALLHVHYDTEDAIKLGDHLMEVISDSSLQASVDLAKEKRPYAGYSDRTEGPFCRNETRTSIAPTGTIAIIADVWGSIEPHFALEWDRVTNEGIKLKERISCWNDLEGFVPKTASEISPEWHVRHQATFQKHTCLGCSKTINLPNNATREDVSRSYRLMHEMGCKGGTVFRDGCRSEQVLTKNDKKSVYFVGGNGAPQEPNKRKMSKTRPSVTHKFRIGGVSGFLTVGLAEDGMPGEIFLRVSKIGSSMSGILDTWAVDFSVALQHSVPLEELCKHHLGSRFEPAGTTDNPAIPVCTSIPDYVVRWIELQFVKMGEAKPVGVKSGHLCPECGSQTIYQAGCLTCIETGCGWAKCG